MNKEQLEKLHKLSRQEKFEIVHLLWEDIAREQEDLSNSLDHLNIVNERLEKFSSGKGKLKSWDEIKIKFGTI
jgi:putative addiction module component (TIGR02574 family)